MKPRGFSVVALAAMIALTGCKMGPNYKRPIIANNPATYRGMTAPDIQQATGGPLGAQKWNTVFTDKTREYREKQTAQVASAAEAVRLAEVLYNGRSTGYLQVLISDTTLYSAQLTLATAQQQEALALVTLYNVLGGGW
jgi:hypothetical protein